MTLSHRSVVALAFLSSVPSHGQKRPMTSDIPPQFDAPKPGYDYVKRIEMIPMRDGVRLYTVIVIPKGAARAPIVLTRTPYNAAWPRGTRTGITAHARRAGLKRR